MDIKDDMTLAAQLARLEQLIAAKYPDAKFEPGIDYKDLQAFEEANKIKIPTYLVAFYSWHNGVNIHSELYLPSLGEAYQIFKTHHKNRMPRTSLKNVEPSTLEELEQFLSPPDENEENHQEYHEVWLPIYVVNHRLYCYLLPATDSRFKGDPAGGIRLSGNHFIFLPAGKSDRLAVKLLQQMISSLMDRLNPPKKTFLGNMKDLMRFLGELFEGH